MTPQFPDQVPPIPDGPIIIGGGPPDWVAPVAVLTILIIVAGIVLFPLVRAYARRLERGSEDPELRDEVVQLRERVAELEHNAVAVQELEERMDFAERLLTQRGEQARLPREGGA
jgi:flagellar biosynthesis/type III secretory pathway M-ring protein FliF/YscJ